MPIMPIFFSNMVFYIQLVQIYMFLKYLSLIIELFKIGILKEFAIYDRKTSIHVQYGRAC